MRPESSPWARRSLSIGVVVLAAVASTACTAAVPLPPKALELNRMGAAALAAGDLPTAEARLALAIEYSPKFTEAWVNLGLLQLKEGELKAAQKTLTHARSLNADLPAPHHANGLLDEKLSKMPQAEASYRAALAVDPGFAPARTNLGRLLFESGRFEEAREQFLRLTEVAPNVLEGWLGLAESLTRLGRERDSDITAERARRRFGDHPDLLLLVARQMLRRGAFDAAEAILEPLTAQVDRRRSARAWAWLGVARLGQGLTDEATRAAEESLAEQADDPVARYVLSRTAFVPRTAPIQPADRSPVPL